MQRPSLLTPSDHKTRDLFRGSLGASSIADDALIVLPLIERGSARKWNWLSAKPYKLKDRFSLPCRDAAVVRILAVAQHLTAAGIQLSELEDMTALNKLPASNPDLRLEVEGSMTLATHWLRGDRDLAMLLAGYWALEPQIPWQALAMVGYAHWDDERAPQVPHSPA